MKRPLLFAVVLSLLAGYVVVDQLSVARAQDAATPKMKMKTQVPEGVETPNTLETPIDTPTSIDGVPDAKTTQLVCDNLDFQRGTQAFLTTLPIASLYGMKKGYAAFGPANTTVVLFEDLMDSRALWLTANTVCVYMASWMELGDEPMVIETPPDAARRLREQLDPDCSG